jgi:hypothetical protein
MRRLAWPIHNPNLGIVGRCLRRTRCVPGMLRIHLMWTSSLPVRSFCVAFR